VQIGMQETKAARPERILDPIARTSEILFGLIMALGFTCSLSAATAGREEIRTLLIGVVGCNFAWGLVDAAMFLMSSISEQGHNILMVRAVRTATTPEKAHVVISGAVPPLLASMLEKGDLEKLRQGLLVMDALPTAPTLGKEDWLGALGVFLLVFLSTFPVVVPFLVFTRPHLALRVSNLVAIVMLFATGWVLARHGGHHPLRTGLTMVALGLVLVAITIALGG
jgi:hypothetical protein